VQVGSELLILTNPQLKDEALTLRGNLHAKQLRQQALQASVTKVRGRPEAEVQRDKRDLAELDTEIESLRNQLRLVSDQLDKLKLRSPIEGQVLTWQPALRLQDRPVDRGEALLEVAQTNGEWIIEVDFPESVVAHLQRQREQAPDKELPASFVVSSAPGVTYTGVLFELATQAAPKNGENVCLGKIRLDRRVPTELRLAGVEVRVKVDCGYQPLGYVLFRELIDFARERVFF
jgi:beta-lactamase class A